MIRTFLLYLVIIFAVRLMGKRQISELQTSELVVTLLISDIASIPMQNTGQPLVSGLVPIFMLVAIEIILSVLMLKSGRFRKVICGRPIVVINDGKIQQNELRRLRMTTEDLFEDLRQNSIVSISDVAYAIVETNGKLSVIKKPGKESVTPDMLQLVVPDTGIETVVISDGVISETSAKLCKKSVAWVEGVLKGKNLTADQVFLMTANTAGDFQIIKKEGKTQ
ncbi:DUF421 domain-containing protein [Faecalispora sporosphaeroides]|uniref:DUF421 domain-containing protein n=1 Tax=Faecalispora sporosphaeroides TaxID=1549 RepID=UPI002DD64284|nr:DUF421 domain-containing protein [Faecalispora sporosphaeroides]